ncbi:MAG: dephospho-CoA kinase [Dehalococcoidia bacterium]|nr:dephospho-CoA kinase [Dehalococcoidia bacterium]
MPAGTPAPRPFLVCGDAVPHTEVAPAERRVRICRDVRVTRVIGLTGGIASGKSVVRERLEARGAFVMDADKLGHEAYTPGTDCFREVVAAFGEDTVSAEGEIDRKALGAKVFDDPVQRRRLEGIVWPWMRRTMEQRLAGLRADGVPVVVLEAAVLVEADWVPLVDEVWVVTAPPALARERLIARNGLTPEQAEARIAAQLTNEQRAARAEVIIENSGTLAELERRVDEEWRRIAPQPQGAR